MVRFKTIKLDISSQEQCINKGKKKFHINVLQRIWSNMNLLSVRN